MTGDQRWQTGCSGSVTAVERGRPGRGQEKVAGRGLADQIALRAWRAGVEMDGPLASALAVYLDLVYRWNRRINVTGLAEDETGLEKLVIEPLVAAQHMPVRALSVVDIGSGGGSPAVPLKLAVPGLELRMVESRARKAAFLREVVRQLELKDVVVERCRYEDLFRRSELYEAADVVTVRAVKMDRRALEGLGTLLTVGGALFLFRSTGEDELLRDVPPSLRCQGTYPLVESLKSRLVVLEKM